MELTIQLALSRVFSSWKFFTVLHCCSKASEAKSDSKGCFFVTFDVAEGILEDQLLLGDEWVL